MGTAAYYPSKVPPMTYVPVGSEGLHAKYVHAGIADTHSKTIGYLLWLVGFTGAHRFYYGRPVTGIIWFLTFGLFGIGWLLDAFLIPAFDDDADFRFVPGTTDYNLAWVLLIFGGFMGLHRLYQGKILSGLLYFFTIGLFGIGVVYDVFTLNAQVNEKNATRMHYAIY